MYNGKKVIVVMPAYNAAKTLQKTFEEIPFDIVDEVILTDDFSNDETVQVAKKIGMWEIMHASPLISVMYRTFIIQKDNCIRSLL